MLTVLEVIKKTTEFLASKNVESSRLNAELLVGHALGLKRMQLYLQFERPLAEAELEKIRPLVRRRGQHEPVQYILGEMEWFGLRLKVDPRALIPRPETEYVLEQLLAALSKEPAHILDLGTGSGALALALAKRFVGAVVVAVDASDRALSLARENAVANGLDAQVNFLHSNWFDAIPAGEKFDLVVANPPYLTSEEYAQADPQVRDFEPREALLAEDEGIAELLRIVKRAPGFLKPGGILVVETGIAQHARLTAACETAGFKRSESRRDLSGRDRFILAWI